MLQVSLINFTASLLGAGGIQAFKTMRTLRALRPLRAMSRMQGMRVTMLLLLTSPRWASLLPNLEIKLTDINFPVILHYLTLLFLGCCQRIGSSHSQYIQRAFSVPHILADICNHGCANVCWKILQGDYKDLHFLNSGKYFRTKYLVEFQSRVSQIDAVLLFGLFLDPLIKLELESAISIQTK